MVIIKMRQVPEWLQWAAKELACKLGMCQNISSLSFFIGVCYTL